MKFFLLKVSLEVASRAADDDGGGPVKGPSPAGVAAHAVSICNPIHF